MRSGEQVEFEPKPKEERRGLHRRKSESTMRGWCDEHGLGRRIGGGTWSVSNVALAMFFDGDMKALRAYHAGDRTGELVAAYFRRAGTAP
jgi:hypothetical protein